MTTLRKALFNLFLNGIIIFSAASCAATPPKTVDVDTSKQEPPTEVVVDSGPVCLFERIYQLPGIPKIELQTDMKNLVHKKMKEQYQPATFDLKDASGNNLVHLEAKVKARGNMRKQVSYFPPLKIDFVKSDLKKLGLLKLDDLKLVLPNNKNRQNKERLLKEYLLYQIYQEIEPSAFHAKLVDLTVLKGQETDYELSGIVVEDVRAYNARMDSKTLEKGVIRVSKVDRDAFAKLVFFEYMIANTDYSVTKHHNIKIVQLPDRDRLTAVPYDFDYSGFVGHEYAVPNPILPIDNVHDRYFFKPYKLTEAEFESAKAFYLSIEQKIYDLCDAATYMESRTIKGCKIYIKDFYKELKSSKRIRDKFIKA